MKNVINVVGVLWFAGCSSSPPSPVTRSTPDPSAGAPGAAGAGTTGGVAGAMAREDAGTKLEPNPTSPDAAAGFDCSSAASAFAYVLTNNSDLYSFAPDQKKFLRIGTVACAPGQIPNSMAVDRNATAWVNYLDGSLHPVSTTDASCGRSAITLPMAWTQDGMAYVATDTTSSEQLYLTGSYGSAAAGLGLVDTTSGVLSPIGQYPGALRGASAELTGTGDGRLFGLFTVSPVTLVEIEPQTGAVVSQTQFPDLALSNASSFAFSFWGGKFYFYTYPNAGSSSTNVSEYDPSTRTLDASFMIDIGIVVVGAGVSTCAPVVPRPPR